jgi:hypothetical protein
MDSLGGGYWSSAIARVLCEVLWWKRVYPLSPPPARFARGGYAARLANRAGGGSKNLTDKLCQL